MMSEWIEVFSFIDLLSLLSQTILFVFWLAHLPASSSQTLFEAFVRFTLLDCHFYTGLLPNIMKSASLYFLLSLTLWYQRKTAINIEILCASHERLYERTIK